MKSIQAQITEGNSKNIPKRLPHHISAENFDKVIASEAYIKPPRKFDSKSPLKLRAFTKSNLQNLIESKHVMDSDPKSNYI